MQAQANNVKTCMAKLSQSYLHRANGPTVKLGDEIIKTLDLHPVSYQSGRPKKNPALKNKKRKRLTSDEENDDQNYNEGNTDST